jgi:hypothetical protein
VSDDHEHDKDEGFLRRWARVKSEAREDAAAPAAARPADPQPRADPREPAPELPSVDRLTFDSDFRGFFHPKVDEDVRRQALRKLFSDPHFNVMDGLDVYIDDYSKTEPIPAAMLAGLKQAQRILEWAAETPAERAPSADTAAADAAPAAAENGEQQLLPEQTQQSISVTSATEDQSSVKNHQSAVNIHQSG